MAIGAVVSSRNFGSFIGSGRVCQSEQSSVRHQGQKFAMNASQFLHRSMFYSKPYTPRVSCSLFGRQYSSKGAFHNKTDNLLHMYNHVCHDHNIRRVQGICKCFLSSTFPHENWAQMRKPDKLGFFEGQRQQSKSSIGDGVRTGFKSEEYDITGANLESLVPSEGPTEAVLVEGFVQAKPWWEQLPKRWVIVLLCFASFLLCNMDRVNMSIAILPMSKEFNWNSATVGVIQSSFFWGYLLTQIIGGIWADKIGGKIVLGFGVVWWSVATVLTPIAARIGLPFLLMMRAFMGIGEGVAMPAMNNLLSKWIPVSERSRSLALVYSGMYLGSVTGLALSPVLIHRFGWPSVFYSFGSLGIIWIALWLRKVGFCFFVLLLASPTYCCSLTNYEG